MVEHMLEKAAVGLFLGAGAVASGAGTALENILGWIDRQERKWHMLCLCGFIVAMGLRAESHQACPSSPRAD